MRRSPAIASGARGEGNPVQGGIVIKLKTLIAVVILIAVSAGVGVIIAHQTRPDTAKHRFVYPRWQKEKGAVWTAIGRPGEADEAIVGPGGEIQPFNSSYTVCFWVYDRDSGILYAPDEMPLEKLDWRLTDGYLPVPISTWKAGGVTVEITNSCGANTASVVRLKNEDKTERRLYLYAVIRPHGVSAKYNSIDGIKFAGGAAYINGHRAIEPLDLTYQAGASKLATNGLDGDISTFITRGQMPEAQSAAGQSTGAFRYELDLKPGKGVEYGFVYGPRSAPDMPLAMGEVKPSDLVAEAVESWRMLLSNAVGIEIPDKRMQDCFYASLAYLMVLKDGPYVVPGPLTYNSIWVRDAAYVIDAFLKVGMLSQADESIHALISLRQLDGRIPPVHTMNLQPLARNEWDSQGQLIYAIHQRYRFTDDKATLVAHYPAVGKTCVFIRQTRQRNLSPELKGTPFFGIMPPSLSAEDIGHAHWHHYWDDFWCIYGLKAGAEMAKALGKGVDVAWMLKDASDLQACTLASIKAATGGLDWIPNGPEDKDSSSAARGTTAGVWPTRVLTREQAIPTFNKYWDKWVKPNDGGFLHGGTLWPYATLSLAHAYLWLGDNEKMHAMLNWALDSQTAPGVYAWSEVANPKSKRFNGGDMPHGWGAAEYVLLLRDMLVRDDLQNITILSGVPEDWLKDGKVIRVTKAPVPGGKLSFGVKGNLEKDTVTVTVTPAFNQPKPVAVYLPTKKSGQAVLEDGKVIPVVAGRFLMPAGPHKAVVELGEKDVATQGHGDAEKKQPETKANDTR